MNQQPPRPRALTREQITLLSKQAAERAELEAEQHNARVAMRDKHEGELAAVMVAPTSLALVEEN